MNEGDALPIWSAKQVIKATLLVILVLVSFFCLYYFSDVLFIFLVAVFLGTAIRPAVEWLKRRGVPRMAGVGLVYLSMLAFAAGVVLLLLPLIANQATALSVQLPKDYQAFRSSLLASHNLILEQIAYRLPANPLAPLPSRPSDLTRTTGQLDGTLTLAGTALLDVLQFAAVFILGFYWTLERDRALRYLQAWIPPLQRDHAQALIDELEMVVGGFLLGQAGLCLVIGLLSFIAYLIIGLPFPLVLAVAAGILEAVPILGPVIGAAPALLIALSISPDKALWVLGSAAVIQLFENHLLAPRVMNRSIGINPIVVLLSLIAFTSLFGLPGAIIAIPLTAVIQILINRFVITKELERKPARIGRSELSRLRLSAQELAQDVRKQLRHEGVVAAEEGDALADALESLAEELDQRLDLMELEEEAP